MGQLDFIYSYILVPMNLLIILKSECNEILKTLLNMPRGIAELNITHKAAIS
jgi:hypothetical protein